jgi:protein transport protein SEC61 subunit gamma-like protein
MADQIQELLDVPRDFLKDGMQFINRSQKRECPPGAALF